MRRPFKIITVAVGVMTLLLSLYIIFFHLGLVDGLDFGAGAYYYADIPDFEKYMHEGAYSPSLPLWVYVILFLLWGCLMWRLLVAIESKGKK